MSENATAWVGFLMMVIVILLLAMSQKTREELSAIKYRLQSIEAQIEKQGSEVRK